MTVSAATTLPALIARIQALGAEVDTISTPALRTAIERLTAYAKSIAHVRTGLLKASLHPEGPFLLGDGTLEARVSPMPAWYAQYEVARGGDHNYAGRTLEEDAQTIAALTAELEQAVAAYVRGR